MTSPHVNVLRSVDATGVNVAIHDHESFESPIRSPQDFADALGYQLSRITKTVFLRSKSSGHYAVAVCAMDRKLDFAAIADGLHQSTRMEVASAEELDRVIGYPKHGVSPLGLPSDVAVVVDEALLAEPTVLIGGGAAGVELELAPADLVWASGARVAQIGITN
ncbi:aminoacyl-tRNA deacylase [Hoyosella subflava]|uniref:Hypothetical conserved protein n=1 Tax=Hoyosella subflava (strain DSM 45089 / JCM 17490 / NBRC 109087 / DQS3-9A1) TaxID=443218 RepID=F6EF83_HOYSD|nr:YbaK/EbsC family protein [Hoyosella subflava]AEF38662.1 Hypothetical conserved protein [Hoyosella subflava DQS3-9A1]